jgi:hypothetical protein
MRGTFNTQEQEEWIHILEFKAVHRALESLGTTISDTCVRLWCDNMTVVSCIKKNFSPKPDIRTHLKQIQTTLRLYNASLIIQWIPSKSNVPADTLSRVNLGDEFRLNIDVFNQITKCMGGLDIDRFATAHNTLLPKFNSYFHETNCLGVDAFAQSDWPQYRNYCNPPFS